MHRRYYTTAINLTATFDAGFEGFSITSIPLNGLPDDQLDLERATGENGISVLREVDIADIPPERRMGRGPIEALIIQLPIMAYGLQPSSGLASIVDELVSAPIVVVESSPGKAKSIKEVVAAEGDFADVAIRLVENFDGVDPAVVLTVAGSIIIIRVSMKIGSALGNLAEAWIGKLEPKQMPISED